MATNWNGEGDGVTWEDPGNWDNGIPGDVSTDSNIYGVSVVCGSNNPGTCSLSGGAQLTFDSSTNYGTVVGGPATFLNSAGNFGSVELGVFAGTSSNSGTVTGDAIFEGSATNNATVNGGATFGETSINLATVSGNATFNGDAHNGAGATVQGNATFNDLSYNAGSVQGTATFNGNSQNQADGVVVGGATFNDSSAQYGNIQADATFYDSSSNSGGIVDGDAIYYDNAFIAGQLNIVQGSHKITNWSRIGSDIKANAVNFRIQFLDVPEGAGGDILGTGLL